MDILTDIQMKPVKLSEVLMGEDSDDLKCWQDKRFKECEQNLERQKGHGDRGGKAPSWPDLHLEVFRAEGLRYPPEMDLLYTDEERRMLSVLQPRCQEVVAFYDMKFGRITEGEEIIDVSQSNNRIASGRDVLPCALPKGIPWARHRFRVIEPNETLACQGLGLRSFDSLDTFTRAELQSLSGNAFSGNTVMACALAALVAFDAEDD